MQYSTTDGLSQGFDYYNLEFTHVTLPQCLNFRSQIFIMTNFNDKQRAYFAFPASPLAIRRSSQYLCNTCDSFSNNTELGEYAGLILKIRLLGLPRNRYSAPKTRDPGWRDGVRKSDYCVLHIRLAHMTCMTCHPNSAARRNRKDSESVQPTPNQYPSQKPLKVLTG